MVEQGGDERARHTALWCTSVEGDGDGAVVAPPDILLRSFDQKVRNPVAEGDVGSEILKFGDELD